MKIKKENFQEFCEKITGEDFVIKSFCPFKDNKIVIEKEIDDNIVTIRLFVNDISLVNFFQIEQLILDRQVMEVDQYSYSAYCASIDELNEDELFHLIEPSNLINAFWLYYDNFIFETE